MFVVQFLLLSLCFGIPLLTFFISCGQYLGSGLIDMWRISPIFQVSIDQDFMKYEISTNHINVGCWCVTDGGPGHDWGLQHGRHLLDVRLLQGQLRHLGWHVQVDPVPEKLSSIQWTEEMSRFISSSTPVKWKQSRPYWADNSWLFCCLSPSKNVTNISTQFWKLVWQFKVPGCLQSCSHLDDCLHLS